MQLSLLPLVVLAGLACRAPALSQEDPVDAVLARADSAGLNAVWTEAQELVDLGADYTPSLRRHLEGASEVGRLTLSRALLDLNEVPDARDGLLMILEQEKVDAAVRLAAIELLGSPEFLRDRKVLKALRDGLETTFEPHAQLALATSLYRVSPDDKAFASRKLEDWLRSDRPELRVAGALALAKIGRFDRARPVLRQIQFDPTDEGNMARAYLEIDDLQRAYQEQLISRARPLNLSDKELRVFKEVYDLALMYHMEGEKFATEDGGKEALISAAANGLLSRMDDHSTFFTSEQHENWNLDLHRDYGGIGAYVDILNGVFTVTRPIYGGPAYDAGLKAGDQIHEVDGWPTEKEDDVQEIIRRLKGPPGTTVKIAVWRRGWTETKEFELTRGTIVIPSFSYEMLPGKIGYVEVITFGRDTAKEVAEALTELERDGMRSLVLDLRLNSGGYLDSAIDMVSMFCGPGKLVVSTKGRRPIDNQPYYTHGDLPVFADADKLPMTVLINRYSASASEIVTGCLRHYQRATVVGEHSYGKGSVQTQLFLQSDPPEDLKVDRNRNGLYDPEDEYEDRNGNGKYDYGPFLKITTAHYFLPNNESIHRRFDVKGKLADRGGIEPDLPVEFEDRLFPKQAELAAILEKTDDDGVTVFRQYVKDHWRDDPELFIRLSEFDGFDTSLYPGFDEFYEGLNTDLTKDEVRYMVRRELRKRATDEMSRRYREFPFAGNFVYGDPEEDPQLQVCIQNLLEKVGDRPLNYEEYRHFDGKDLVKKDEDADQKEGEGT